MAVGVVLAVRDERRKDDALEAWARFEAEIQPCPFPRVDDDLTVDWHYTGCDWLPEMIADSRILHANRTFPARARFCLSERFFDLETQDQINVLLHESIHVRLFLGRLQRNYRLVEQAQRPDGDDFEHRRWDLAAKCLSFAQEVGADRYLRAHYPDRWEAYLGQRLPNFYCPDGANALVENDPGSLIPWRVYFRLLRAELGLSVVDGPENRVRSLTVRRDVLRGRLTELLEQPDFLRLTTILQPRVLAVEPSSDEPDPDDYRELFDEVLRIQRE